MNKNEHTKQLILNPVENLPELIVKKTDFSTHGLYVSDKIKTSEIMRESKIAFSGRSNLNELTRDIYGEWAEALNASSLSMRLLSGLHAHIILFMGLGCIGDTVMLLPEEAGGHYATEKILLRLGYRVVKMVPDYDRRCIDIEKTIAVAQKEKPSYLFVDRSEGIEYENFSPLVSRLSTDICCIFDASQYLTNILCGDFTSPFDMGFELMMATLHKNFPGPQKALVCSKKENPAWKRTEQAMSDYVSSLHVESVLMAGEILKRKDLLSLYSTMMLQNKVELEQELIALDVPVIVSNPKLVPTHHLWLRFDEKDQAFLFFKNMEECDFLVNYRKLPYGLGMGIRMGTSAGTLQGLNQGNIPELARLISSIYHNGSCCRIQEESFRFIDGLVPLSEDY